MQKSLGKDELNSEQLKLFKYDSQEGTQKIFEGLLISNLLNKERQIVINDTVFQFNSDHLQFSSLADFNFKGLSFNKSEKIYYKNKIEER